MRKAGPILILLIGILALSIDFFPGLHLPDSQSADGTWRVVETKLGLDLKGGLRAEYQALPVDGKEPGAADMAIIKDIVERRVNTTGVSEPVVTTQGKDRVVVELPGVTDREAIQKLIGQTGRLDFVPLGPTQVTEGQVLDPAQYPPQFSGDQVASATVGTDQNGRPAVDFVLKDDGRAKFAEYTASHVGQYFAITLDHTVISAPVIKDSIPGGTVQISGGIAGFSAKDATELVTILKFGSLPFPIVPLSSETISATLGSQFLDQTVLAGLLGIALVLSFMLIYYRLPGLVVELRAHLLHAGDVRRLPAHPGDPHPGRDRGLRALGRHGGRRQHPHLRADEGGAAGRQVPAGRGRGRVQPGLELHPRLERVEPHHRDDPVHARLVGDPRLRARPDHRRPRLDVQRDRRDAHDPALGRPPGVGAQAVAVRPA